MRRAKINEADLISMPLKVLMDQRLKPTDKLLICIIPYLPTDRNDTRTVGARTLSRFLSVTDKTVSKSIERLDKTGYVEIKERREGNGGGFRVLLKRTGLVGVMLACLAGGSSALHSMLRADETRARGKVTELYIIRQRRRRQRSQHPTKKHATVKDDWYDKNRTACRHPFGQLQTPPTQRLAP
jgi:DNA-binding MarR family transcriptional regulator